MKEKFKNSKGITLVSIIITVVILTILSGITVYVAQNLMSNAEIENITTDLLLIQAKCKIVSEKTNFDSQANNLMGTKLSETKISTSVQNLIDKNIIQSSDLDSYYMLTQEDLNNMGLNKLNAQDGYIVNYQTQDIIYVPGVKSEDDTMQYKLSEMKSDSSDVNPEIETEDPNLVSTIAQ